MGINGTLATIAIGGAIFGGTYGAVRGFVDTVSDPGATWEDVVFNTINSAIIGAALGGAFAATVAYGAGVSALLTVLSIGAFTAYGAYKNDRAVRQSFAQGKNVQGSTRIVFGVVDLLLGGFAIKGVGAMRSSPAPQAGATPKPHQGRLGGTKIGESAIWVASQILGMIGVKVEVLPKGVLVDPSKPGVAGRYYPGSKTIVLKSEPTYYMLVHEAFHAIHHYALAAAGKEYPTGASGKSSRNSLCTIA